MWDSQSDFANFLTPSPFLSMFQCSFLFVCLRGILSSIYNAHICIAGPNACKSKIVGSPWINTRILKCIRTTMTTIVLTLSYFCVSASWEVYYKGTRIWADKFIVIIWVGSLSPIIMGRAHLWLGLTIALGLRHGLKELSSL